MISMQHVNLMAGANKALLTDISICAEPGRVTVVLGPEGAGKTELADVVCGVVAPDGGSIEIDGHDLAQEGIAARRCIGYMPQDPSVYREMTPRGQLRFVGQVLEIGARAASDRAEKILRLTGLADSANTPIRQLPRAYVQRVVLAQALMSGAANIVLDCPTDGLDAKQIFELRAILKAVCAEKTDDGERLAVLLTTDNLTEACEMGDMIYLLEGGRITGRCEPQRLAYLEPDSEKTELIVACGSDSVRSALESAGFHVGECRDEEDGTAVCLVETGKGIEGRKSLFAALAKAALPVVGMRPARRSMAEVLESLKSESFVAAPSEPTEGAEAK